MPEWSEINDLCFRYFLKKSSSRGLGKRYLYRLMTIFTIGGLDGKLIALGGYICSN